MGKGISVKFAMVFVLASVGSFPAWSSPGRIRIRAVQTAKAVGPWAINRAVQEQKAVQKKSSLSAGEAKSNKIDLNLEF